MSQVQDEIKIKADGVNDNRRLHFLPPDFLADISFYRLTTPTVPSLSSLNQHPSSPDQLIPILRSNSSIGTISSSYGSSSSIPTPLWPFVGIPRALERDQRLSMASESSRTPSSRYTYSFGRQTPVSSATTTSPSTSPVTIVFPDEATELSLTYVASGGTWDVFRSSFAESTSWIVKICVPETYPLETFGDAGWNDATAAKRAIETEADVLSRLSEQGIAPRLAGVWRGQRNVTTELFWEAYVMVLEDMGSKGLSSWDQLEDGTQR